MMANILVVEDEVVIAFGACMILEDAGHCVVVAYDGEAGLMEAAASTPDLVLTDYMMPRMDGLRMIDALRKAGLTMPIILATAVLECNLPDRAGQVYDAFLRKPYRGEALVGAVDRLLGNVDVAPA